MNAKKKGNRGENLFATWLRANGIKAYRDSASGGTTHKGDLVNGLDLTIEVKTVKKINLKEAWAQVSRDASIAHNSPLLAIHLDGMPAQEWLCVIHSEDWLAYQKASTGQATSSQVETFMDPTKKYDVQRLIEAAKKVLKHFNGQDTFQ